jgi:hypothetical protein
MDFKRRFGQQKHPAPDQSEIPPGNRLAEHCQPRFGESHDPGNREQQSQARNHREAKADSSGKDPLFLGEPTDKHREKDNVIDPQDNFQRS